MAEPAESRDDVRSAAEGAGADMSVQSANPAALDPIIHVRVRLGIVSALAVEDSLTFNELKQRLNTSDGNLSVHARKLEEAGYVDIKKSFEGRMPRTDYSLTRAGRRALEAYLDHMEALIERVRD